MDLHCAYIPRSRIASTGEQSGTAKGGERRTIPGGTAVIRGFNFDFRRKDHHIRDIGVMMNGSGALEVYYGDKKPDDTFDWEFSTRSC